MKIVFAALLLTAFLLIQPALSFADEDLDNPNLRVSEGKVISVNRGEDSITIDAGIPMTFYASRGTKIRSEATMYSEDIRIADINPGDYVTVEYIRKGEDSRSAKRTLKITVENKVGGNN